jgi:hypothetical protein
MLKHAAMRNMLWAEAIATSISMKNRIPTTAVPNSTPYERLPGKKPHTSPLRTFGYLAFAWIHGDISKQLHNHAYKYVLRGYFAEISTLYRDMDISKAPGFIAQDIKFDRSILYHQLLRTHPKKQMLKPASELPSSELAPPIQPPHEQPSQLIKAKPRQINPLDYVDDDLSSPPDSPDPD